MADATGSSVVITMTTRDVDRLKTIQAVVDGMMRVGQDSQRLGMSPRQIERMLLRTRILEFLSVPDMDRALHRAPDGHFARNILMPA